MGTYDKAAKILINNANQKVLVHVIAAETIETGAEQHGLDGAVNNSVTIQSVMIGGAFVIIAKSNFESLDEHQIVYSNIVPVNNAADAIGECCMIAYDGLDEIDCIFDRIRDRTIDEMLHDHGIESLND